MGVWGRQLAIYLISKVSKRFNGSGIRWKAIPQMCATVAETSFQKIGKVLRQSNALRIMEGEEGEGGEVGGGGES